MQSRHKLVQFESLILPHLDAAYNLARWLTRSQQDAEDVAQEALLRAFRFFDGFNGEHGRGWLLKIVRNTFYTWAEQNRKNKKTYSFEDLTPEVQGELPESDEPIERNLNVELLSQALDELPVEFREIIVLRELEGFTYKEIAGITNIPIGTVMSRLSRARKLLTKHLAESPGVAR